MDSPTFPMTNKATGTITYGAGEPNDKPHVVGLIICSWLPAILKAGEGEVAEEWRKFIIDNTFCLLFGMPETKGVPNQPLACRAKCRFAVTLLACSSIQQEKIGSQLLQLTYIWKSSPVVSTILSRNTACLLSPNHT